MFLQIQPGIKSVNFYVSGSSGKACVELVKDDGSSALIQG